MPRRPRRNGRRLGDTGEDLLRVREVLGASPTQNGRRSGDYRGADLQGEAGKSTVTTTHLARAIAVQSYRLLVVDTTATRPPQPCSASTPRPMRRTGRRRMQGCIDGGLGDRCHPPITRRQRVHAIGAEVPPQQAPGIN